MERPNDLRTRACWTLCVLLGYCLIAEGQPFFYKSVWDQDQRVGAIVRINLRTDKVDTVLHSSNAVTFFVTPDESRMILTYGQKSTGGSVSALDLDAATLEQHTILESRLLLTGVLDAPRINLLYISFVDPDGIEANDVTLVFNRSTYQIVDSTQELQDFGTGEDPPVYFLSRDDAYVYSKHQDGEKSGIRFDVFSTSLQRNSGDRQCGTLDAFKYGFWVEDARNGMAVIGLKDGSSRFILCDVDNGSIEHIVTMPFRSLPRLSADARKVLMERSPWKSGGPSIGYPSGSFYIFDSQTGILLRMLNTGAGGRLLVFDGYPDEAFYYVESENRTVVINLKEETPTGTLIDSLTAFKHHAEANGWLADKNFVNELDNHLENAQTHLAKRDSVNARKEIEKFQEKVDEEYQKTFDDRKKGKARDKRFVTEDGWKLLYFNAQYIIERLPAKSKNQKADKDKKPKK
jgi:hypothetical protein